nr:uncharacterized protein LOC123772542 [Procambarus clarkii]
MCSSIVLVVAAACMGVTAGYHVSPGAVSGAEGGRGQLGASCPLSARHVTLTSTRTFPSTFYTTSILHVPTTVYQVPHPPHLSDRVHTYIVPTEKCDWFCPSQVLTGTRYVSQVRLLTETKYVTVTESLTVTDTEVPTVYVTRTRQVTALDTVTTTVISTRLQRRTQVLTTTQYRNPVLSPRHRFVTQTERVPQYSTSTLTSYHQQYHTVTHTRTEDEYISHTSLLIQTVTVTRCSGLYG